MQLIFRSASILWYIIRDFMNLYEEPLNSRISITSATISPQGSRTSIDLSTETMVRLWGSLVSYMHYMVANQISLPLSPGNGISSHERQGCNDGQIVINAENVCHGAGEMTRWVKHLLCKCEGLSSGPRIRVGPLITARSISSKRSNQLLQVPAGPCTHACMHITNDTIGSLHLSTQWPWETSLMRDRL